jgi:hypothetical protein
MSNNAAHYARKARNESDLAKKIDALARAIEELGDALEVIEKDVKRLK